jgi:hypothetical protein
MEVDQGPNWGFSAKEKKLACLSSNKIFGRKEIALSVAIPVSGRTEFSLY